jgi:AAA+ superfamily predicted ATPase
MAEFQSSVPDFRVSWLLGIEPAEPMAPKCEFETDDADFSVSWLLGLQSMEITSSCPAWASQYETTDSQFRVSWLLGLEARPQPPGPPSWAKQFETADPLFRVSCLLGLEQPALPSATQNEIEARADLDDPISSLIYLFGEAPYPKASEETTEVEAKDAEGDHETQEAKAEESETSEGDEETEEQRRHQQEFLDVANALEHLLDEIEARNAESEEDDDDDNESIDGLGPDDCADEDPSRLEWCRQKKVEFAENEHIERVMSLPGLTDVKAFFLRAKAKFMAADRRETVLKKTNFNVIFSGNQGTGKSMVSRLYAKYLLSMGFVKPQPGYTGIQKGMGYNIGCSGITETLDGIKLQAPMCGGCIIIIEDAHHIDNRPWNLWRLYRAVLELKGNFAFILNAEEGSGMGEVLAVNAQLPAELPMLKLKNYTKPELRIAFEGMLRVNFNKKMTVEGGMDGHFVDILLKRVQKSSSEKSFTNMWALRKAFFEACKRQYERFKQARRNGEYPEDFMMTKADLLGVKPDMSPEKSPAWKELQTLVGLDEVKDAILSLVHQVSDNMDRELRGEEMLPISANRVFLGSPGTGKTTVAKLYAKILSDFGILSKGEVVVKNSTDLIDRYIGGSENNTKDALQTANGSVLIIDDAHMLDPGKDGNSDKNGDFRGGILDTLVAEVSGQPGEDRCVILCGYENAMKDMFQNGNPGLARRFPLDTAFVFPDFSLDVLGKILDLKVEQQKTPMTEKAREVAIEMLQRASVRPNFGNGGEVDNILSKGSMARTKRLVAKMEAGEKDCDKLPIEPEDFDPDWDRFTRAASNTRELFKDFVGYEDIISKFESYQLIAQGMRLRNLDPRPYIPFTFVFKGAPGTGKTSTARKLGKIFYDMGFLAAPDVIEVSASQMVAEYCGQTAPKTRRLLESALGKVLFIDEAYRLAEGKFAEEAVSELVDAVTKEKFRRKLIIVLAGYEEDMDRLMRVNQGMRSRFATELEFKPMRGEQCLEQLRRHVSTVGIEVQATTAMDSAVRNDLLGSLCRMTREKDWASGRSVETLGDKLIGHVFKECALKGYTGKDLTVSGRDLMRILGLGGLKNGVSLRAGGRAGFGASQVMTLKDLGGYE